MLEPLEPYKTMGCRLRYQSTPWGATPVQSHAHPSCPARIHAGSPWLGNSTSSSSKQILWKLEERLVGRFESQCEEGKWWRIIRFWTIFEIWHTHASFQRGSWPNSGEDYTNRSMLKTAWSRHMCTYSMLHWSTARRDLFSTFHHFGSNRSSRCALCAALNNHLQIRMQTDLGYL